MGSSGEYLSGVRRKTEGCGYPFVCQLEAAAAVCLCGSARYLFLNRFLLGI